MILFSQYATETAVEGAIGRKWEWVKVSAVGDWAQQWTGPVASGLSAGLKTGLCEKPNAFLCFTILFGESRKLQARRKPAYVKEAWSHIKCDLAAKFCILHLINISLLFSCGTWGPSETGTCERSLIAHQLWFGWEILYFAPYKYFLAV